jgi:hypothetical protein
VFQECYDFIAACFVVVVLVVVVGLEVAASCPAVTLIS